MELSCLKLHNFVTLQDNKTIFRNCISNKQYEQRNHITLSHIKVIKQYFAMYSNMNREYICKVSSKNSKQLLKNLQNTTGITFLPHPVHAFTTVKARRPTAQSLAAGTKCPQIIIQLYTTCQYWLMVKQLHSCTSEAVYSFITWILFPIMWKQVLMYYRSGTGICCWIGAEYTHQVAALFCMKWRHSRQLECVTSNQKSDSISQCVFTRRTLLPNFIPIRFEMTEP